MIYFATLAGGTDRFDPGAEDVRRFHNHTSRVPTLAPDSPYAVRWVAPILYRLPGGRWVMEAREGLPAEITPEQALRWCAESGSVIEWENRFRWRSGDSYPLVVHDGPPEIVHEDCEEWRPAAWFEQHHDIKPNTLSQAASKGKVRKKGKGRGCLFSVADARRCWPRKFAP